MHQKAIRDKRLVFNTKFIIIPSKTILFLSPHNPLSVNGATFQAVCLFLPLPQLQLDKHCFHSDRHHPLCSKPCQNFPSQSQESRHTSNEEVDGQHLYPNPAHIPLTDIREFLFLKFLASRSPLYLLTV